METATSELVHLCKNAAVGFHLVETDGGRAICTRVGDEAATELRMRGEQVPEEWEAVERQLEGI